MEAMRALIENDRQLEGCFTTYNSALERAALKKDRYLNPAPAEAASPIADAKPPAPPRPPVVAGNSVMAEKLLQAGLLRPKAN
jgi:hypothetical protein